MEELTGILTLVNSRAGADVNGLRIILINDDGKHIRVVNHAVLDDLPVGSAVAGLPGQVPSSGIDDVRVWGINGHRLKVLHFVIVRRSNLGPAISATFPPLDPFQRAPPHTSRF